MGSTEGNRIASHTSNYHTCPGDPRSVGKAWRRRKTHADCSSRREVPRSLLSHSENESTLPKLGDCRLSRQASLILYSFQCWAIWKHASAERGRGNEKKGWFPCVMSENSDTWGKIDKQTQEDLSIWLNLGRTLSKFLSLVTAHWTASSNLSLLRSIFKAAFWHSDRDNVWNTFYQHRVYLQPQPWKSPKLLLPSFCNP